MRNNTLPGPIEDARVRAVIERVMESPRRPLRGGLLTNPEFSRNPQDYAECGFSIGPDQGVE